MSEYDFRQHLSADQYIDISISTKDISEFIEKIKYADKLGIKYYFNEEGLFNQEDNSPLWPAQPGDENYAEIQQKMKTHTIIRGLEIHNEIRAILNGSLIWAIENKDVEKTKDFLQTHNTNWKELVNKLIQLGASMLVTTQEQQENILMLLLDRPKYLADFLANAPKSLDGKWKQWQALLQFKNSENKTITDLALEEKNTSLARKLIKISTRYELLNEAFTLELEQQHANERKQEHNKKRSPSKFFLASSAIESTTEVNENSANKNVHVYNYYKAP